MMASVSRAAGLSRRGRSANCARSIASAYSRRVRNCHPCAISINSTPWSLVANAFRSSASAVRSAVAPACGSRVASSSTVSGRAEANSAASTSFASGLTADLNRGERPLLVNVQRAALGKLEQGDESGQVDHDRRGRRGGRFGREAPPELLGPARRRRPQPFHELVDLLVLEQPAYQLGARIFPVVVAQAPRQEHLCLDP